MTPWTSWRKHRRVDFICLTFKVAERDAALPETTWKTNSSLFLKDQAATVMKMGGAHLQFS